MQSQFLVVVVNITVNRITSRLCQVTPAQVWEGRKGGTPR